MFPYKRIVIAQHERGLLMKDRSLQAILEAGVHRYFDPFGRLTVEVHDTTEPVFDHRLAESFATAQPDLLGRHVETVRTTESEAALVFRHGTLEHVLAPGAVAYYWKAPVGVRVERVAVDDHAPVAASVMKLLARRRTSGVAGALQFVQSISVPAEHTGLLFIDRRLVGTVEPGLHGWWTFNRAVKVDVVDRRVQAMEVNGQEMLTRDKVTLRVNLTAAFRVTDPARAVSTLESYSEHLYRELQLALRQGIATRTLDSLLESRGEVEQGVLEQVQARTAGTGMEVDRVGLKDLILPGDMRDLLNQVVEAEKVAQANVIRRREETAATRSLLNTARLMDENPTLLRLKELESLEKVADKVDRLTVFGGLDGVLKDTVRIDAGG